MCEEIRLATRLICLEKCIEPHAPVLPLLSESTESFPSTKTLNSFPLNLAGGCSSFAGELAGDVHIDHIATENAPKETGAGHSLKVRANLDATPVEAVAFRVGSVEPADVVNVRVVGGDEAGLNL